MFCKPPFLKVNVILHCFSAAAVVPGNVKMSEYAPKARGQACS